MCVRRSTAPHKHECLTYYTTFVRGLRPMPCHWRKGRFIYGAIYLWASAHKLFCAHLSSFKFSDSPNCCYYLAVCFWFVFTTGEENGCTSFFINIYTVNCWIVDTFVAFCCGVYLCGLTICLVERFRCLLVVISRAGQWWFRFHKHK